MTSRDLDINVGLLRGPPIDRLTVEVVERKGLGHSDSICDALAEALSVSLCRFYRERFGIILHHNVDKALLCGGSARPAFGGGKVIEPIELFLAGRATTAYKGVDLPVAELAIETSSTWLAKYFHALPTSPTSCSTAQSPSTAGLSPSVEPGTSAGSASFGSTFSQLKPRSTLSDVNAVGRHPVLISLASPCQQCEKS